MSSSSPKRFYPNLEGIANPKSPFEVQTALAMRQAYDHIYSNTDTVASMQQTASSAASSPAATSGNWWNTAYGVDTFGATVTATAITLTWSGLRIAPASYVNRKTAFLNVPNGSQANAGLTATTTYWFYPGYDTRSGIVVWGTDPAFVIAGTFAHTAPSGVALMKVSSGGIVPLSQNGFSVKTVAGTLTGLGGGLLHGVPQ